MWINQCRNIWMSYSKLLHFRDSLSDAMIIINFVSGSFVVFASSEVDRSAHRQTHTHAQTHIHACICANTHTHVNIHRTRQMIRLSSCYWEQESREIKDFSGNL